MKKKMKQSKKFYHLVLCQVLILALLGVWGLNYVYASLTDHDQKENDLQIGEVKGNLTEKFNPPTKENPIKSGDTYQKEVTVSNTSSLPFFVRVLVTPEIQTENGLLLASNIGNELTIDLGSDWLLGEDGFYYYLKEVFPDTKTSVLFSKVTLLDSLGQEYNDATLTIGIKSETVTSSGNNYRTAWWQGASPSEKNLNKVDTSLQATITKNEGS